MGSKNLSIPSFFPAGEAKFQATLRQLSKDLSLDSATEATLMACLDGEEVRSVLHSFFSGILKSQAATLGTLLYRIDIPEKKVKALNRLNQEQWLQALVELTLERCYQKVCLREFFSAEKKKQLNGSKNRID